MKNSSDTDEHTNLDMGSDSEATFSKLVHMQAELDKKTIRLQKGVILRHGLSKKIDIGDEES